MGCWLLTGLLCSVVGKTSASNILCGLVSLLLWQKMEHASFLIMRWFKNFSGLSNHMVLGSWEITFLKVFLPFIFDHYSLYINAKLRVILSHNNMWASINVYTNFIFFMFMTVYYLQMEAYIWPLPLILFSSCCLFSTKQEWRSHYAPWLLLSSLFSVWFPFLGNVNCVLKLSICRKVKI